VSELTTNPYAKIYAAGDAAATSADPLGAAKKSPAKVVPVAANMDVCQIKPRPTVPLRLTFMVDCYIATWCGEQSSRCSESHY
jgi:NADPH-dependent 2,4-dienoyl-CoA reductase/sulfur reductase-like enzyme